MVLALGVASLVSKLDALWECNFLYSGFFGWNYELGKFDICQALLTDFLIIKGQN